MLLKRMTIVLLTSGTQRKIRFLEMDDCDGKSDRFVEIGGNELNHRHLTKEWIWQMPNPSWWRSPNWKSRLEASWPNGLVIRNRHLVSSLAQQNEYDLRQDWLLASARDDTESNKKIEVVAFTFKRLQETCVRQLRMAIIHFGVIMIDIWL